MWVWILRNSENKLVRLVNTDPGGYGSAPVFWTEDDADKAILFLGGVWSKHKVWLSV